MNNSKAEMDRAHDRNSAFEMLNVIRTILKMQTIFHSTLKSVYIS